MPKNTIILYWSALDQDYVAHVPELGCAGQGPTYEEALANVQAVMKDWAGQPMPQPKDETARYDGFTDGARKVMQLANEEARRFNHEYVGTEHLLLALVEEGSLAATVLEKLDIDLQGIHREVDKIVQPGPGPVLAANIPHTPRSKRAIEFAIDEARKLNHDYIGTEHLLLGLVREDEGVAAQILMNLGLSLQVVRQKVLQILGHFEEATSAGAEQTPAKPVQELFAQIQHLAAEGRQAVAVVDNLIEQVQQAKEEAVDDLKRIRATFLRQWPE